MLFLSKEQRDKLIEHARKEAPDEACGIIAGKDGKSVKIYQMTNTDKSAKTFFMDPGEQLKVMKEIRNSGREMTGIYHSHPATEAYPSRHDVELAFYPQVSYVIISLKNKHSPGIRSFKITDGKIIKEDVKIE